MGYAALYGVFGSLLGTNIGAFLWAKLVVSGARHRASARARFAVLADLHGP